MKIILAQPRGFCAGVDRAIEIVLLALKKYGAPVYVRHEIVHNKYVVDDLRARGAVFIDDISQIPAGAITVFSAHGVSEKVENEAKLRDLPIIDATCPLVTKVHNEAIRYEKEGREIILIGHKGHPEVEGTSGRVQEVVLVENLQDAKTVAVKNPDNLAYVTQTTLSLDDTKEIINALKERFPNIDGPDTRDICYATQNRQNAVRELAGQVDVILVIGANNSSNSNRLRDLGHEMGRPSYLIATANEIDAAWFSQVTPLPEGEKLSNPLPEGGVGGGLKKFRPTNSKLVEKARELRKNLPQPELLLWSKIKSKQLHGIKFRHQEPIDDYIVDFVSYEKSLIIELDGETHVGSEKYDERRTKKLEEFGFKVLRFWNKEVMENLDGVIGSILHYIKSEPTPSPSLREGSELVVGLTAGASAPELLVEQVIDRLKQLGASEVTTMNGKQENIKFKLPSELVGS